MNTYDKLTTYLDWCYLLCDSLEGNNLNEFAQHFIKQQTAENISRILEAEVTEKAAEDFRNELDTVSGKLMVYCCGSPILYTMDKEVNEVFDRAVMNLFITVFGDLD